jgi:hypothetical protein
MLARITTDVCAILLLLALGAALPVSERAASALLHAALAFGP